MKAIILAAGRGTRLKPITNTIPKPMIQIVGKPIIEHNIENIYKNVSEITIVVKYLKEKIIEYFGENYKGTPINYIEQSDEKGTAAALRGIQADEDILMMYGDSIFEDDDLRSIINLQGYGCLVQKVEHPQNYGIFSQDSDGNAIEVVEKPQEHIGNLANIGVFKFSNEILDLANKVRLSERNEYELTDAINAFCSNNTFQLVTMKGKFIDIGYPEDIQKAEEILQSVLYLKPQCGEYRILEEMGEYKLTLGIPKSQIKTLINYSQDLSDTDLQENTGDLKRFSSEEKFTNWYNDANRFLFCMLDSENILAGIYWGRPTQLPNIKKIVNQDAYRLVEKNKSNIHTNGIRIYPHYRGKGLAKFLFKAEDHYENIFPSPYWSTDVSKGNIASCKGFEKKGYTHIANGKNINNGKAEDNDRRIYVKIPKK